MYRATFAPARAVECSLSSAEKLTRIFCMNNKFISLIAACGLTLIVGCGGNSSTTDTTEISDSTTTQSAEDLPTWVINSPGDAFSAVAAQTVCDIMRTWSPPIETSAEQVAELEKYTNSLRTLIGSPSDSMYGGSHVTILALAEALLANEENYPTDDVMNASFGFTEGTCDDLGLTPENSKYGLKD